MFNPVPSLTYTLTSPFPLLYFLQIHIIKSEGIQIVVAYWMHLQYCQRASGCWCKLLVRPKIHKPDLELLSAYLITIIVCECVPPLKKKKKPCFCVLKSPYGCSLNRRIGCDISWQILSLQTQEQEVNDLTYAILSSKVHPSSRRT